MRCDIEKEKEKGEKMRENRERERSERGVCKRQNVCENRKGRDMGIALLDRR